MKRRWKSAVAALAAIATIGSLTGVTTYAADSVSITNVSYDPTRELYEQYNKSLPGTLEGKNRPGCGDHTVPWWFRQAGT